MVIITIVPSLALTRVLFLFRAEFFVFWLLAVDPEGKKKERGCKKQLRKALILALPQRHALAAHFFKREQKGIVPVFPIFSMGFESRTQLSSHSGDAEATTELTDGGHDQRLPMKVKR